ncbi:serine hydrolase domain-containing protein [Chryseobacterium herbae]|uniref:Beta-lactamase family protein n=1 Tax=Chryseobacterium herbae TaxID=2976476 RepID=A0ABT2IRL8_9FLAO|nr:serine hydrolase domain-containing protein [Chryseobacterium sp. pc1-10]MCT2561010.1 beta-lactamase family protein [Chryseobacterium sp. pc1-10]
MKNFILLIILFSIKGYAQNIDKLRIDSLITAIEINNQDIGSISIFKNNKEVYSRTFGEINIKALQKTQDLKYHIGSVSKMITATLIFKLVDEKKISLDDKLFSFFPDIPNSKKITIKNLLEHTSGLQNFVIKENNSQWLTKKATQKEIIEEIIKQGVAFQPGEKVFYSNSAYYLLTKIVESKYNSSYSTILEEKIIKPLKLKNFASFHHHNYNTIAPSYRYENGWIKVEDFYFENVIGVGDIASTMYDTNVFISQLFAGQIICITSLEKMVPADGSFFGRGLINLSFGGNELYGHYGDTYGSHSIVLFDIKNKTAISLVVNGERLSKDDFVYYLLNILYKNKRKLSERQIDGMHAELYTGIYSSVELPFKLKLSYGDQFLKAEVVGDSPFTLDKIGENKFEYFPAGITLEFNPSEKKMLMIQRGQKYQFTRDQ